MKRFHVHMFVEDLQASVAFYSKLFAAEPARVESDYAKWMLEDPRINFAISSRGGEPGVDHFGFQTDTADELLALKTSAQQAETALRDEGVTTCCYSRSEKHWITDPTGMAWEHFHTLEGIPVFNEAAAEAKGEVKGEAKAEAGACCAPTADARKQPTGKPLGIAVKAPATKSACC